MKDEESLISHLSTFTHVVLRDVWLIWFALSLLTTLPYVLASLRTPSGYVFSGVLTAYDDTFTYFAWMRHGADGHLLMCNPFTSEPQRCEFFIPLWSILGLISRAAHIPIPLAFHAARLLAALVLLIVARAVAGTVIKSRTRVQYSLWLYITSAGFGWLVYVLKNGGDLFGSGATSGSADLNLPEAIAFRSVFSQVHFSVGVILMCGAIMLLFNALINKRMSLALSAGVLVSLLSVVHPYMVVVVCAITGVAMVASPWLKDQGYAAPVSYSSTARLAGAFAAGTLPGAAYAGYLNRSNEVLREWLRVTDTFSPPPWEYALGFGIVGVLAVAGFRLMWKRHLPYGRLLLTWALVQAALLYAPLSIQRRFIEGLQLPLAIASSVGLFWIARKAFKRPAARRGFLVCAVAFASLTNVGFLIGQVAARAAGSGSTDPRRYLDADLVAAFDWLRTNGGPDGVLFSSYLTGNVAPSATGLRVFLGHYAQTLRSDEKGSQVTAFYANAINDEVARKLFGEHRVRYVIYGPFERGISNTFIAPAWLKLVHRVGDVELFALSE